MSVGFIVDVDFSLILVSLITLSSFIFRNFDASFVNSFCVNNKITVWHIDLSFEDKSFNYLFLENTTLQISDRGKIVIEFRDLSFLRKLDCDLDSVLGVHTVDNHATLRIGWDRDDEGI